MKLASETIIWLFPNIGVPQNGWFIMENPIFQWRIWGGKPLFLETSIYFHHFVTQQICLLRPKEAEGGRARRRGSVYGQFDAKRFFRGRNDKRIFTKVFRNV